jgi:hypothetical protein
MSNLEKEILKQLNEKGLRSDVESIEINQIKDVPGDHLQIICRLKVSL